MNTNRNGFMKAQIIKDDHLGSDQDHCKDTILPMKQGSGKKEAEGIPDGYASADPSA